MLDIYAGPSAIKMIEEQGFKADLFTSFLGASGGPKWFSLFGLDKYLFSEFFANRKQPLNIIGSSAGAFRSACFCTNNPVSAITELAQCYTETIYDTKRSTPQKTTISGMALVESFLGENDARINDIVENPIFKAHFIVAKAKGLVASENKLLQGLGLFKSFVKNYQGRQGLASQYERFIYHTSGSDFDLYDPYSINTSKVALTKSNFKDALLASGCIPMVMAGIKDIEGSPKGVYRDGGVIDYHFDFKIKNKGLTLYPHFNNTVKAGWFDKNLKRGIKPENYDNIVLVSPSKTFIDSLPYGKIPDRKDYINLDNPRRMEYWKTVLRESEQIAEYFANFCEHQPLSQIKPISQLNT
jgi:hypothetical protein